MEHRRAPLHRRRGLRAHDGPTPSHTTVAIDAVDGSPRSATTACRALAGPRRPRVVDVAGRPARSRASRMPTCIPSHGGAGPAQLRPLGRSTTPRRLSRPRSGATPGATPTSPWILGGGWAMAAFPGGTPPPRPRRAWCLTARSSCPTATTTARGQHQGHGIAGIDAASPEPPHGRYERDADGVPTGPLHEGAMDVVTRPPPGRPPSSTTPASSPVSPTSTPWASPVGRTRSSGSTPGWTTPDRPVPRPAGATSPPTSSAPCGGTAKPASEQVESLVERRREFTHGRVPRHQRQGDAGRRGRELHRRDATPYLDRHGRAPARAATPSSTRCSCAATSPARRRRVPGPCPRDRRPGRARGARRVRGGPDESGPPTTAHHVAHLQVVHPDDVDRFAGLGVAANMQALWACLDDQMVDLTHAPPR